MTARTNGSGWYGESRRHAEAAKKGRPRRSPARPTPSADTDYQIGYLQDFLKAEQRDLTHNNKLYDEIVEEDPFSDDQTALVDLIQEGQARIDLLEPLIKEARTKGMTNRQFAQGLKARQEKLSVKAEKLWQKEEALGETNYDEDEFEKVINARHAAEWQSSILTNIIRDIERGETYR